MAGGGSGISMGKIRTSCVNIQPVVAKEQNMRDPQPPSSTSANTLTIRAIQVNFSVGDHQIYSNVILGSTERYQYIQTSS